MQIGKSTTDFATDLNTQGGQKVFLLINLFPLWGSLKLKLVPPCSKFLKAQRNGQHASDEIIVCIDIYVCIYTLFFLTVALLAFGTRDDFVMGDCDNNKKVSKPCQMSSGRGGSKIPSSGEPLTYTDIFIHSLEEQGKIEN